MSGVRCLLCTLPFATSHPTLRPDEPVRLACLNHAASVRSEPGSNSSLGKICRTTRLSASSESASHGIQQTMSPGWPGCCRPGQPVFPYARRPRATCGRDTLPLCLGSNCSLDKERPGLAASVKQQLYEDREACQRPACFFLTFFQPRWYERQPGSEAVMPQQPSPTHSIHRLSRRVKVIFSAPHLRVWQRFLAWDDFLRLGRSAGVYPRRILAGAAANGRRA